jgi:hypothetical protein
MKLKVFIASILARLSFAASRGPRGDKGPDSAGRRQFAPNYARNVNEDRARTERIGPADAERKGRHGREPAGPSMRPCAPAASRWSVRRRRESSSCPPASTTSS